MRGIPKRQEPTSLTEHRCSPGADYEGYRDKDTRRSYLVNEQRSLCCYCLSRIRARRDSMKIEHWHCQASYEAEELDYANMLASCLGNEGRSPRDQHCDTRKGDRELSRNPANPNHRVDEVIAFLGDGTIVSLDPKLNAEINEVLNLNLTFLRNNRKAVLDGFLGASRGTGRFSRDVLEKWLREWNGESDSGDLKPFCQVVVYWLRKRLMRA